MRLLLAEDDRAVRITVRDALDEAGYATTACESGTAALAALGREPFDMLLTDVRLPGVDGLTLFRRARQLQPDAAVVVMTAYADADDAVAVIRGGARDYIQKPFEMEELLLRLGRVRGELEFRLRMTTPRAPQVPGIVGSSAAVRRMVDRLEAAAASDVPVLISGETGTGKDLCARTIHDQSARAAGPFVVVNCAAIPEALLEAELFGHEKGAFTGADRRRVGRFEAAAGGTLLLDEVGELPAGSQAKLLRVIESSSFEPVGSSRTMKVDVRLIAATNRDLAREVARGTFRKDLFYRLNVIDVWAPPLRERRTDIPELAGRFLQDISARQGRPVPALDAAVVAALAAHDYPGNIRELLHVLERAVALARGGELRLEHLPEDLIAPAEPTVAGPAAPPEPDAFEPLDRAVAQFTQQYIRQVLARTGGHRTRTAELLGISRKSLWERLRAASGSGRDR